MHTHSLHITALGRLTARSWWRGPVLAHLAILAALGLALALPLAVEAKTFHCGAGDVQCLIDAINAANANGQKNTIRLEAGTYTLTVADNFANGLPVITSTLTITGQGAETTIIERDASARVFRILTNTGNLTLKGLTLRGGANVAEGAGILSSGTLALAHVTVANNFAEEGGGIFITSGTATIAHSIIAGNSARAGGGLVIDHGTLTLLATTVTHNDAFDGGGGGIVIGFGTPPLPLVIITESTIDQNRTIGPGSGSGGGIANGGTLVITNTTIAANTTISPDRFAMTSGGGIANGGTLVITNSTLAENSNNPLTGGPGGGLVNGGTGTVRLQNTIIARNSTSTGPDCSGTVTSLGSNLIGDPTGCTITLQPSDLTGDPGLDAFTDNGRPGNGHFPLLPTSQAIDAGSDAVCPRTDQLGRRRIGPCDIGAIRFLDQDDRQRDEDTVEESQ